MAHQQIPKNRAGRGVAPDTMVVVNLGIDTHQEPIVYMRRDCHICRAEGFSSSSRVALRHGDNLLIATLNVVDGNILPKGKMGLSKIAMKRLGVDEQDVVAIFHAPEVESLHSVRKKIFGHKLSAEEIKNIVEDISVHRYRDIEIASFLSACAGSRLDIDEIIGLTKAMVACGKQLHWPEHKTVFDKHCIGGLPGNRTTPLVVSIVSAGGLVMPKTSSRAITSPAGTADMMEALTNVELEIAEIRRVVEEAGACLAWGGAVNLSPADDLLIRIERALDLDGEGQLIASVLSKKIAAGSTHAVVDIPVGDTAKVRSPEDAQRLASLFTQVGASCGIKIRCVITDGCQPVGRGIGPVEEARDVLAVLQCADGAPLDLRERALFLSGHLFNLAGKGDYESCYQLAYGLLDNGEAWRQFQRIVKAQGGLKVLPEAAYRHTEVSPRQGTVRAIDNRQLARLAKLAGAPWTPAAGLRLHVRVGDRVNTGDPLFTLFSDTHGERDYALEYYRESAVFDIEEVL